MGGPSSSGKKSSKTIEYEKSNNSYEADSLGMKATPKEWGNNLTSTEREAIQSYTGSTYSSINKFLREGTGNISNENMNRIEALTGALKKAKLESNITVFRGTDFSALGSGFDKNNYQKMVGAVIKDKGFMSTSLLSSKASGGLVKFEIRAKKGTSAAYIKSMSKHTNENEVLFNKGTKMKIQSIEKKGLYYHIVADVV